MLPRKPCVSLHCSAVLLLMMICASSAWAQTAPQIDRLSLYGLQQGHVTTITVHGQQLAEDSYLTAPFAIARQRLLPGGDTQQRTFEVTLTEDVPAGIYPLRMVTAQGLSNAVLIGVDALPQLPFEAAVEQLPVALHGTLTGAQILQTAFSGRQGQRVCLALEGQRLGSQLRGTLEVYGPERRLVAVARPDPLLAGDTRCEIVLPGDGVYTVELHDELYRGPSPGFFRLKMGALQMIDATLPLAATAGTTVQLNLLGSSFVAQTQIAVPDSSLGRYLPVPWPAAPDACDAVFSGSRPVLAVHAARQLVEVEQDELLDLGQIPLGISGRIASSTEVDRYRLAVQPGRAIRCEVFARRRGSPLDAVLRVRDPQGTLLAENDDLPDTVDPGLEFTVPAETTSVVVEIASLTESTGPLAVYHLTAQAAPVARMTMRTQADRLVVPAGGRSVLAVDLSQENVTGPIQLMLDEALAPALQMMPATVQPDEQRVLLTFQAQPFTRLALPVTIVARSVTDDGIQVVQPLESGSFPGSEHHAGMRQQLATAVIPPGPLTVDWADEQSLPETLLAGLQHPLSVQVQWADEPRGKIRCSLLTSQIPPTREEENRQVPDLARTLRLLDATTFDAGQLNAPLSLQLAVPADLAARTWSFAVQVDWLDADEQQVRATAFTTVHRAKLEPPLTLELTGPQALDLATDETTVTIQGQVHRHPRFRVPVTVAVQDLPEQMDPIQVTVAADQSEFVLPVPLDLVKTRAEKQLRLQAKPVPEVPAEQQAVRSNVLVIPLSPEGA